MKEKSLDNLPITIDTVEEVEQLLQQFVEFCEDSPMITPDMTNAEKIKSFIKYKTTS